MVPKAAAERGTEILSSKRLLIGSDSIRAAAAEMHKTRSIVLKKESIFMYSKVIRQIINAADIENPPKNIARDPAQDFEEFQGFEKFFDKRLSESFQIHFENFSKPQFESL